MLSRSYDSYDNAIEYSYKQQDGEVLTDENGLIPICEKNRSNDSRRRKKYVKSIKHGNYVPNRDLNTWKASS